MGHAIPLVLALAAAQAAGFPGADRIAAAAHGRVGAAAVIVETGETLEYHAGERFPMQSVYKFPIGMAVLHDVDAGRLRLDQEIRIAEADLLPQGFHSPIRDAHPQGVDLPLRDVLRFMVTESDGTASDVLLRLVGGPQRVAGYLHDLPVLDVTVATPERAMASDEGVQYRNWATPTGMASLLTAFYRGRGLSAESRDLLMRLLTETTTFPKRLKGLLPPGTIVAHKTGSSGTSHGLTRATNDVGLVTLPDGRHLAIAVFVSDSRAAADARDRVIAEFARAAWDRRTKK
jgi:beta-lactamase class A